MDKLIRWIVITGVLLTSFIAPTMALAGSPLPPFCQVGSLPSHDPQYPADQFTLVCIPPGWNGDLVMYAHGYVPPQAPLALPGELFLPDGSLGPIVSGILYQGYAFATTSYHKNGYAVEQARMDLNDLQNHVKKLVKPGSLHQTFLVGASEGGEITALMIEHFPDKYAGALAMCGPIGGGPYQVQYLSDFRAAFDYYFPGVFPFGITDVPANAFMNWPDNTTAIATAMALNPMESAQLLNVTGAAVDPANPATAAQTAISILYYSVWGTNDLIATAGGMPYDNQATVYLDPGLNAGIERVASDGRARAYMQRFYQTTGELTRPMVTLHNLYDPIVPFQHETIYTSMVLQAGHSDMLQVIPVPTYGHCNFTPDQIGGAFTLLVLMARP